jgi:hypothetical protein
MDSPQHKATVAVLIVASAAISGLMTYPLLAQKQWLLYSEYVIMGLFSLEVILRALAMGLTENHFEFFYIPIPTGMLEFKRHNFHSCIFRAKAVVQGIQGWNCFDLIVVMLCFLPGHSEQYSALRLARLVNLLHIALEIKQLRVLLQGLADGLRSIFYILILLAAILYFYVVLAVFFFQRVDRFHFESMGAALVTLLRMSMGGWTDVMNTAMYGCLVKRLPTPVLQAIYCPNNIGKFGIIDGWRRSAAFVFFISYIFISTFVAFSLFVGVITTSMSRAMSSMNSDRFLKMHIKRQAHAQRNLQQNREARKMQAAAASIHKYQTPYAITGKLCVAVEERKSNNPHQQKIRDDKSDEIMKRTVVIKDAEGLAAADKDGTADPYVVVLWNGKEIGRTEIIENTCNPKWNQGFDFKVPSSKGGKMRMEVFDYDPVGPLGVGSDDFLGEIEIDVGGLDSFGGDGRGLFGETDISLTTHKMFRLPLAELYAAGVAVLGLVERTEEQAMQLSDCMEGVEWFQTNIFNVRARQAVCEHLTRVGLVSGATLFEQGDLGDAFYILLEGQVEVLVNGESVVKLDAGSCFGDQSLNPDILDDQRNATIQATENCVLARLSRQHYQSLTENGHDWEALNSTVQSETLQGIALRYRVLSVKVYFLTESDEFHWIVIILVLIGAVLIGIDEALHSDDYIPTNSSDVVLIGDPTYLASEAVAEEPGSAAAVLKNCSLVILCLYTAEVVLKIVAYLNPWQNWRWIRSAWDIFDCAVVIIGWVPVLLNIDVRGAAILRVLRLMRVLKEFKSLPQLQMIIHGLQNGFAAVSYVGMLLFMLFYCYALAGLALFRENDPDRFGVLHHAVLTLISLATEGGWHKTMYINTYGCDKFYVGPAPCAEADAEAHRYIAPLYFISFRMITSLIILKLLVGTMTAAMQAEEAAALSKKKLYEELKILGLDYKVSRMPTQLNRHFILPLPQSIGIVNCPLGSVLTAGTIGRAEHYERVDEDRGLVRRERGRPRDLAADRSGHTGARDQAAR